MIRFVAWGLENGSIVADETDANVERNRMITLSPSAVDGTRHIHRQERTGHK